jgi:hypothetical protein
MVQHAQVPVRERSWRERRWQHPNVEWKLADADLRNPIESSPTCVSLQP